jgi:hypothetical protein
MTKSPGYRQKEKSIQLVEKQPANLPSQEYQLQEYY